MLLAEWDTGEAKEVWFEEGHMEIGKNGTGASQSLCPLC